MHEYLQASVTNLEEDSMSDRNPFDDAEEPMGLGAPDAGDPHAEPDTYDPKKGNYADWKAQRENFGGHTCVDCGQEIAQLWTRCEDCAREAGDTTNRPWLQDDRTAGPVETDPEWTFGRVVVSVVPAATQYEALALGTAAFSLAETDALASGPRVGDADVQTLFAFETEPAQQLTDGWDQLTAVASINSETGTQLFETAIEQTDWKADGRAHIYRIEGDPVAGKEDVEALRDQIAGSDDQYWIIPGFVRRYRVLPESEVPDAPTATLHCRECEQDREHRYTGKSTYDIENGWPVWVCTDCHKPRFASGPDHVTGASIRTDVGEPRPGSPADLHTHVITAYHNAHDHYPWEL